MINAAVTGFATGFSLILAIGAQNAFVLRHGLMRQHVFLLCLLCATADAILITIGVVGFGTIVFWFPHLPEIMTWAGAIFLFVYGAFRLWAAWRGNYEVQLSGQSSGLWATLATATAFTWLNPHVYVDTVGLIGAISTDFAAGPDRISYGVGAVVASFVFFFSLGYGARFLAPFFQSARAWRGLDFFIGILMWLLAYKLIT